MFRKISVIIIMFLFSCAVVASEYRSINIFDNVHVVIEGNPNTIITVTKVINGNVMWTEDIMDSYWFGDCGSQFTTLYFASPLGVYFLDVTDYDHYVTIILLSPNGDIMGQKTYSLSPYDFMDILGQITYDPCYWEAAS